MLQEVKTNLNLVEDVEIGCISPIRDAMLLLGAKHEATIYIVDLADASIEADIIDVPFENLNCGSGGISSLFLLPGRDSMLFSCKNDEDDEESDVPLILAENLDFLDDLHFSFFFDPCASKPSRQNQFYFATLPVIKWSDNLVDLVLVGNYASPDIGICGRLDENEGFQPFYIDNDEGLAQLPFVRNELTYPVGLAVDLSSKAAIEILSDPDAKPFPAAPILWVLTTSAHLCPFYLLKTDESESHSFMRPVKDVKFGQAEEGIESIATTEELPVANTEVLLAAKTENLPVVSSSVTSVVSPSVSSASETLSPQTPSKISSVHLASLQKSAEIKPVDLSLAFKAAPVVSTEVPSIKPVIPIDQPAKQVLSKTEATEIPLQAATKKAPVVVLEEEEPSALNRPVEKMETIEVDAYRNILLTEVALTHESMQDDIFTLKQLSQTNASLLRRNSQKYFNALDSLESYAGNLENLLTSSDKILNCVNDRLDDLKTDLSDLLGRMRQIKGSWTRIKQDNNINWDSRISTLNSLSVDLFERIDRVRSFMSNPSEAKKYQATLQSFVNSTQEKIQLLMLHLSGLFVVDSHGSEFVSKSLYSDFESLNISSDSLSEQFDALNVSPSSATKKPSQITASLLKSVKSRGARLLIPTRVQINKHSLESPKPKLSTLDESLIESLISAINLTDDVPEFPEITLMSRLALNDADSKKPITSAPIDKKTIAPVTLNKEPIAAPIIKTEPVKIEPVTKQLPDISPKQNPNPFALPSFTATSSVPTGDKEALADTSTASFSGFKFNAEPLKPSSTVPKMPGIFTAKSEDSEPSKPKPENPLASLGSLSFMENSKEPTSSEVSNSKQSVDSKLIDSIPSKSPNNQIFNMSTIPPPSKPEESSKSPFAFTFDSSSKPNTFSTSLTPSFGNVSTASQPPSFGGLNNPNSNVPVFGAPSLPTPQSVPVFGSSTIPKAPSFGSVSVPSAAVSSNAPLGGGFAAFASQSASTSSANGFAAVSNPTQTGLTFASFLPSNSSDNNTNQQQQKKESDSSNPKSSFSFTGFRD